MKTSPSFAMLSTHFHHQEQQQSEDNKYQHLLDNTLVRHTRHSRDQFHNHNGAPDGLHNSEPTDSSSTGNIWSRIRKKFQGFPLINRLSLREGSSHTPDESPNHTLALSSTSSVPSFEPMIDSEDEATSSLPSFEPMIDSEDEATSSVPSFEPMIDSEDEATSSAPSFKPMIDSDDEATTSLHPHDSSS